MAISLGEAIANQGVYRPDDPTVPFTRGVQLGMAQKQRRDADAQRRREEDDKMNELINKSVILDAGKYTPALYQKALGDAQNFVRESYALKNKYGSRFTYTPEFNELKNNTNFTLKNLEEESAKFRELEKGYQTGAIDIDPEFLKAGKGSYQDWLNYKNELTGEYVDPQTGRSNVLGSKKINYAVDVIDKAYSDNNLYGEKGRRENLAGGEGFYKLHIPEAVINQKAIQLAGQPENIMHIIRNRKAELTPRIQQLQMQARAVGDELSMVEATKAAAADIIREDLSKERMSRFQRGNFSVDQSPAKTEKSRREKFEYVVAGDLMEPGSTKFTDSAKSVAAAAGLKMSPEDLEKLKVQSKDYPFISVQYAGSEGDNKPLYTATGQSVHPLGFVKKGNDWELVGAEEQKQDKGLLDVGTGQMKPKDTSKVVYTSFKDRASAARIANYLGYESIGQLESFLDSQYTPKQKTNSDKRKINGF